MGAGMSVTFTPQFSQTQPGLITGYLRSEPMNGLTQQLTKRGLPWAQVGDCLLICGDCLERRCGGDGPAVRGWVRL
jgi:hypothetical protein